MPPVTTKTPSSPTSMRTRAKKGDGELLRDEILDVAERLLIEKGSVAAVSIRAIANGVGITPPSIYRHFTDKDDLFFSTCSRRFYEMAEVVSEAMMTGTAGERIEAVGRAYVQFGLERGEQYIAMFQGIIPEHLSEAEKEQLPGNAALMATSALIQMGVNNGEFRTDIDPDATAIGLWALVHGLVLVILSKADIPQHFAADAEVIDQALSNVLRGLTI